MRKQLLTISTALIVAGVLFFSPGTSYAAEEQADYLALGDSITAGYRLTDPTTQSFAALVAVDIADSCLATLPGPTVLHFLTSAAGYTLRPAAMMVFIGILMRRRKSGFMLWSLVVIVGVIAFTSYFTHVMFWFGDNNQFMRGPLSYLTHIVCGLYLVILVVDDKDALHHHARRGLHSLVPRIRLRCRNHT